jgi:antitoxin MazE
VTKRLQAIGNSAGIIVDKPILELLGITADTDLELTTDGRSLIITPRLSDDARARKLAKVQKRTLKNHKDTFRKLAK